MLTLLLWPYPWPICNQTCPALHQQIHRATCIDGLPKGAEQVRIPLASRITRPEHRMEIRQIRTEAGRGTRTASSQAPRLSALHGSRSRSRGNLRSDSRHNIRWNDSSESLVWSSQEDLAQLLPDRASADGVERPPQEGFSGRKQWLLVRDWPGNRYAHCTGHGDTLSAQLVFVLA